MDYYKSSLGENVIFTYLTALQEQERVKVIRALKALDVDKTNSEGTLYTKLLRKPVFELKIGAFRVFYMYKDGDVYILHIIRKTTGKTEQIDIDLALKRAEEVLKKAEK